MDLEELAFKNVNELTKLSKEELLMIIALLQQDRKCWIWQFTKTHNNSVDIRSRTDKAIQYLEKNACVPIFLDCKMYETSAYNDLLKILKGSDK